MTKIAILGGGSWGTALAIVLSHSRKAHEISLWMRDAALAAEEARAQVVDALKQARRAWRKLTRQVEWAASKLTAVVTAATT